MKKQIFHPRISIIIPARGEERSIMSTLEQLDRYVSTAHEVIVVNDRVDATDKTADVVKQYSKSHPHVQCFVFEGSAGKSGFSGALLAGISRAKGSHVVFVMADACDDPRDIDRLYKKQKESTADIVCGSRYIRGGKKSGSPLLQGVSSLIINVFLRIVTGIPTWDASNSFKMYLKPALRHAPPQTDIGVEYSMLMVLRAYFQGAVIVEIPTIWKGREMGVSKFSLLARSPKYFRILVWSLWETQRMLLRKYLVRYETR